MQHSRESELAAGKERWLNVKGVLRIIGVSRSGYLAWKKRQPSESEQRRSRIKEKIRKIYEDSHRNYGAPKIKASLDRLDMAVSERTVGKYMRQMGIGAQYTGHYTVTTRESDFSTELRNILDERFNPSEPNSAWCSDITYIWTCTGSVYLTSVMDLFSRKIVSWVLSTTLETGHVVKAVRKAMADRKVTRPLVLHSDRGAQYTSGDYMAATSGLTNSYSEKLTPGTTHASSRSMH